jgi:hypothetical protein
VCVIRAHARPRKPDQFCSSCSVSIYRYTASGLCRKCVIVERLNGPETQVKRTEGVRRYAAANKEALRCRLRRNHAKAMAENPSYVEFLRQRIKVLQPLAVAASHTPEVLARRSQNRKLQPPLTFEEKLQLVSEGKLGIYNALDLRSPDPSGTLGGVSTGWMG